MHVTRKPTAFDPAAKHNFGRRETQPAPVVVEPSQEWDGNDGPWSSFALQVGTPPQQVRVDISIAGQETWVVSPGGCADAGTDCTNNRGGEFNSQASSTWQSTTTIWKNSGIYQLAGLITNALGIDGTGEYGFDTVGLSFAGQGGPAMDHTVVAAYNTTNFYIGQFGVSPNPTYFTVTNDNSSALDDPQDSFFTKLNKTGNVPSLSYSFTAGSAGRRNINKNALGSFTFGGYDASLKGASNMSFDFAPNEGRELVVAVQSITKGNDNGGTTELLPDPIFAALDSSQPNIWLPEKVCQNFEKAFNLTWNATAEQYLVDATLHDRLVEENSSVTFRLGNGGSGGPTTDIVLPYSAFDLSMANSTSDSQPYFPLKRADNDTQYTLGRAFFQEAYLIADWERHNFSLSQRVWNDSALRDIVPIYSSSRQEPSSSGSSPETGAIVGIVLGILAGILAVAWWQRRWCANMLGIKRVPGFGGYEAAELPATEPPDVEMAQAEHGAECDKKTPMEEEQQQPQELPTSNEPIVHEMDAGMLPELPDTEVLPGGTKQR